MSKFVGSENPCDVCADHMRRACWMTPAGARLCRSHFHEVTGEEPTGGLTLPLLELPRAESAWAKVVPGLRARPAAGVQHGVELQAVRNVQLDGGTHTVADAAAMTVPDAALVELVLMASAHRDATEPNKLLVRAALFRILHGTEAP